MITNESDEGFLLRSTEQEIFVFCFALFNPIKNMVERMYTRVYESIREGDTICQPLKESKLVDDIVVNMIDFGEETGDLDTMLYKIADIYDEEVNVLVESLIKMLEPIMTVVLGLIVGTIVIALFMPMLKLLDGLSK